MLRLLILFTVVLLILPGCNQQKAQIDNGIYAARSIAQIAKDMGVEADVHIRIVPNARAGFYGPGVEIDSRTEVNADLSLVPTRSGGNLININPPESETQNPEPPESETPIPEPPA